MKARLLNGFTGVIMGGPEGDGWQPWLDEPGSGNNGSPPNSGGSGWTDASGNPTDGTWGQPPGDNDPGHFVPQGSQDQAHNQDPQGDGSSTAAWIKTLWPIVKEIVKNWSFKGHSAGYKRWKQDASTEVHWFFTHYCPQLFLDWMDQNHPDGFGSRDGVKDFMVSWCLTAPWGTPLFITPEGAGSGYSGEETWYYYGTPAAYAELGIDYDATLARSRALATTDIDRIAVYLPEGVVPDTATIAGQDAVDAGNDGDATQGQTDILNSLLNDGSVFIASDGSFVFDPYHTDPRRGGNAGPGPSPDPGPSPGPGPGPAPQASSMSPLLILAAGAAVLFAVNKN